MKRFLCAIAMLVAFIPFVGVEAINETKNYYSYKKGQVVNFYPTAADEAAKNKQALEVMIVEDKDTTGRFIKVWTMGGVSKKAGDLYLEDGAEDGPLSSFLSESKAAFNSVAASKFETGAEDATEGNYFIDFNNATKGLNVLTLTDLYDMFGDELQPILSVSTGNNQTAVIGTTEDEIFSLGNAKVQNRDGKEVSLYDELTLIKDIGTSVGIDATKNGFYVYFDTTDRTICGGSTCHGTGKMYVSNFSWENNKLTGITLRPVVQGDQNVAYMFLPTMYANKTADCHETTSMCYVCNGEYKWATVGSQDSSCTEYKDAKTVEECKPTKCYKCVNENGKYVFKWVKVGTQGDKCEEVTDITSKNQCSELVKTGVESHILEFAIVAALCVIALVVVKRKDLFKTI